MTLSDSIIPSGGTPRLGYLNPMEFEMKAGIAYADVAQKNRQQPI